MANISQFRPSVQMPPETAKFLKHFSGNIVVCPIGEKPFPAYLNPTTEEYQDIWKQNAAGVNVYFTVNDTDGQGRSAEHVTRIRAVFCDDDEPKEKPRSDFAVPPSLVVRTSTLPEGHKFHYYWITSTTDIETWRKVQKGLIEKYARGLDKSIHDAPRILRLPGFKNCKTSPYEDCVVVDDNGLVYEWETILKAFPPITEAKLAEQDAIDADGEFNVYVLEDRFRNPVESGYITNSINSIIQHMANQGYSARKIQRRIDQLYETIPPANFIEHQKRYYDARVQVEKFIKTAKAEATRLRAQTPQSDTNVTNLHPEIPEPLDMDWSMLRSNPIPEDCIPECMLKAAKEVGDWTAAGQDPAILSGVFITSALLSKNVLIHEIEESLTTHCQSGICIVMDTGARKSSIYNQMNKPFFEFEEQIRKEWEDNRYVSESLAKAYDTQVAALDKAYAKNGSPSQNESFSYAKQRGALLAARAKLQLTQPWLRSADVTEEKLIRKMAANQGCMAVISDDARSVINNLAGKYGKDGNTGESVYINALTGSSIMYERVGSEDEIAITHPVLNALLFVQPDAALKLRNSEMFVPSGLAARLPMYFYPVAGADIVRNTKRRPLNLHEMEPYYRALRNLCVRRIDNPLHIRMSPEGMQLCAQMDQRFANLLDTTWRGHYDKSNKLVTLTTMYATCFAALSDPAFTDAFRAKERENATYILPPIYLNMGFQFAIALFGQSIVSYDLISFESLPRKANSFLSTLTAWYDDRKIYEGFVPCGALNNYVSPSLREFMPDIIDLLTRKKWLITTTMTDSRRKLNGGFPDKYVDTGDTIFHLNRDGIQRRQDMNLESLEKAVTKQGKLT